MTLKEYLDMKAHGYHFDDYVQEITINAPSGGTEVIQLGALKSFLDKGYSVSDTDNLLA